MTLVELLMAIVVLAIGLVALSGLFAVSAQTNARARDGQFAVDEVGAKLDELRNRGFGDLRDGETFTADAEGCSTLHGTVSVRTHTTYTDLKVVSVHVDWDGRSRGHLDAETIVAPPD
jgi:Tfp pilus assembly protein PilV